MRARIKVPKLNGRRGAFQLLFSAVYLVIGLSFVLLPASSSRAEALAWLNVIHLPVEPFAFAWVAAALVGFVSAFLCRPSDWRGFAALTLAPALWGALFFVGAVFCGAPILGLVTCAVYWLLAATAMVVSDMSGPNDRDHRRVVVCP